MHKQHIFNNKIPNCLYEPCQNIPLLAKWLKKGLQEENKFHKNEIAYLYKMQGTLNLYDVLNTRKKAIANAEKHIFNKIRRNSP